MQRLHLLRRTIAATSRTRQPRASVGVFRGVLAGLAVWLVILGSIALAFRQ